MNDECPKCHVSLKGEVIPEPQRELFGGAENFNRGIAIYDREKDQTVGWQCPDCGYEWRRNDA